MTSLPLRLPNEPVKIVFEAELWLWDAKRADAWMFVSLPAAESEEIRALADELRRSVGSLRARATIGGSTWETSIFSDPKKGYVLQVERRVREAESLTAGDVASVTVELLDFAR